VNSALDDVRDGFLLAMRRPHLLILDLIAKLTWLILTVTVFGIAGIWFASGVQLTNSAVQAFQSGVPALVAVTLIQSVISNGSALVETFAVGAITCFGTWILLEAFVRGGLLPLTDRTFVQDAADHFLRYLWVGLIRRTTLGLGAVLAALIALGPLLTMPVAEWAQIWPDVRWAALAGLGILVLLAFGLMTIETLIRSDAIELLGVDLSRIVGIVLVLALVEAGVVLGALAASALIMQWLGSPGGLVLAGILFAGVLSVSHSYILLVRYSAVGIMRRDIRYGAATEHASDL
jgi:hypothetical protein